MARWPGLCKLLDLRPEIQETVQHKKLLSKVQTEGLTNVVALRGNPHDLRKPS